MNKKVSITIYIITELVCSFYIIALTQNIQMQDKFQLYILCLLSIIAYTITSIINPGYINLKQLNQSQQLRESNQNQNISENINKNIRIQSLQKRQKHFISQRKCKYCSHIQIIRQKHCKVCDKCVCTFDHHCTFVNNCIGQFNRPLFLIFLVVQSIQILINLLYLFSKQLKQGVIQQDIFFISFLLVCGGMSYILFGIHFWLMIKNLTTYELIKKDKIWYFQQKQINQQNISQQNQSQSEQIQQKLKQEQKLINIPGFNQGILKNLLLYWQPLWKKQPTNWKQYLKLIQNQ